MHFCFICVIIVLEKIDYPYLCNLIGSLAGIPVRIFENGEKTYYHSVVYLPRDPMTAYEKDILSVSSHIGYYVTPEFQYYGVVRNGETSIIIGPSMQIKNDDQTLKALGFLCDVPQEEIADFVSGMRSIIPMPLDSILQMLCSLNYMMNGEKLGLQDLRIYEHEQELLKAQTEELLAERHFDADESDEEYTLHNTLASEQTMLTYVRRGDSAGLREWTKSVPAIRPGVLAGDTLRQLKNTFIVTATLVSRSAIRGGMPIDEALTLSDAYIQKCELLSSIERITNLQYRMIFDYTERVEKLRLGKAPSKFVLDVTNFVRRHLSDPITTEDVASALFLSRSRISVKFKEETGITITDFILKEKTDEAKRLLRYSDKPAVAISNFLGFSSQSHFSRVFKKYAGCVPAAASSIMSVQSGWSCKTEAGTSSVTGPFAILQTASALLAPLARMRMRFACMIWRMPIVNAFLGTSSGLAKRRALSLIVLSASETTCVPLPKGVSGSLKAICPLLPSPKSWISRGIASRSAS